MTKLSAIQIIMRRAGLQTVSVLGGTSVALFAEEVLTSVLFSLQCHPWHYNRRDNVRLEPSLFAGVDAAWTASNKRLTATGMFANSAVGQTVTSTSPVFVAKVTARSNDWIELDTSIDASDIASVIVSASDGQIKIDNGVLIYLWPLKESASRMIVQTGRVLFDQDANSDIFSSGLTVSYKIAFDIGCLPEHIATFVADSAAVQFIETYPGADRNLYRPAIAAREQSARVAKSIDTMQANVNVFRDRRPFGDRPSNPSVGTFRDA
jgi:hypothetical protein